MELFEQSPIKNNDLQLIPATGPSCWLLGATDHECKEFMGQVIRHSIWSALSAEMAGDHPRRKDMKNFNPLVNVQASLVGAKPPKTQSCKIPAKLWKQLHLTVITGATVAGDRLHAMGRIESDGCPLDNCRHTAEHLYWECTAYAALRRPFLDQIGKIKGMAVTQGASVQHYVAEVLADTTFRNLGLVPGDTTAPQFAKKQWSTFVLKPPVDAGMLITDTSAKLSRKWAGQTFRVIFTDGSIKNAKHPWLAHGGWVVFAGPNSLANDWGHLKGPPFSSYRAELRALIEAFSRATVPVWVVCDNKAVADQAAELLAKNYATRKGVVGHPDLALVSPLDRPGYDPMWDAVDGIVSRSPLHFFKVSWIPGHLLDEGHESKLELFLQEGGLLEWAQGNKAADHCGEKGAQCGAPPTSMLWRDFLVTKLARTVQAMQVSIWAAFQGHLPSDLDFTATEVSGLAEDINRNQDVEDCFDLDDPFVQDFLAQEDEDVGREEYEIDLFSEYDPAHSSLTERQSVPGDTQSLEVSQGIKRSAPAPSNPSFMYGLDDLELDRVRLKYR